MMVTTVVVVKCYWMKPTIFLYDTGFRTEYNGSTIPWLMGSSATRDIDILLCFCVGTGLATAQPPSQESVEIFIMINS